VSADEIESAVVDRIVDDVAVLLVGEDETEVSVPLTTLPSDIHEGSWLLVRRSDGEVTVVGIDPASEERQRERVTRRMERLHRDRGGGRFGTIRER
jgi:hypothetical protein